jgi:hypothetical protein
MTSSAPAAAPAPTPTIDFILSIFAGTLHNITSAVADIPDERLAEQPSGVVNHPAWTLAHLGSAAGFIISLLDEPVDGDIMAEFKQFGPGSQPTPDRSAYASRADMLATLAARHARAEAAVRAKHTTHFDRPPPEFVRAFAPTIGRLVVYLLAAHESYHLGQLMQWRRAAGMGTK